MLNSYTNLIHAGEGVNVDKGTISTSGSGVLILSEVEGDNSMVYLDATYDEIVNAGYAILKTASGDAGTNLQPLVLYGESEGVYAVAFYNITNNTRSVYIAASPADRPGRSNA